MIPRTDTTYLCKLLYVWHVSYKTITFFQLGVFSLQVFVRDARYVVYVFASVHMSLSVSVCVWSGGHSVLSPRDSAEKFPS